jgi:hypothetical protein
VTVLSLYFPARIIHGALRGPTGMVTRPAFRTPSQGKEGILIWREWRKRQAR